MKIQPIINSNLKNSLRMPILRHILSPNVADSFEKAIVPKVKFEEITLKTAQKICDTKFELSKFNYSDYKYPTFVFNKKTGKPVEVFVKPIKVDDCTELYHIICPNESNVLGTRSIRIGRHEDVIDSGYMKTYSNDYIGVGLRAHQIAIERMLMKNFTGVNIVSVPEAYEFHKGAGFSVIKNTMKLDVDFYNQVIAGLCRDFEISDKKIKDLVVATFDKDEVYLEKYATYENILKYLYSQSKEWIFKNSQISLYMDLPEKSLNEWKKLIDSSPIFINKKFPSQVS